MTQARIVWQDHNPILLDMDGTVLDLAFDNYFWRELVPRHLARTRSMTPARAQALVYEQYDLLEGSLRWYCLDYWTGELGLDLKALKIAASQRIRYLPGARGFLLAARAANRRLCLVTNAHPDTLAVKDAVTGLTRYFDSVVSAHELGYPKEEQAFWAQLVGRLDFDPERAMFVDDSEPVLAAARQFGIGQVVAISRPDSSAGQRSHSDSATVAALADLI